ncbi:MAG: hypothetical protein PUB98_10210 [Clostridiales bacterium]|nr:hypothetical protein [Clostridiales bacterium]
MKSKGMIVAIAFAALIGCGEQKEGIKYEQLREYYLAKVEYTQEEKDIFDRDIDRLCKAYVGETWWYDDMQLSISEEVKNHFDTKFKGYKDSSYYDNVEEAKLEVSEKTDAGYLMVGTDYSKDCIVAMVSILNNTYVLKMTYENGTVTEIVEYRLATRR